MARSWSRSVAYMIKNRVVRVARKRKGTGRMAKAEATVEELVGMIERGELRLPEMQRRYVWRSTRVRN